MRETDFSKNLRLVCNFEYSVSAACRTMNINRQQFSKYLNGISKPSARNLNKICNYFGIHPSEFFLPHDEFASSKTIENRWSRQSAQASTRPALRSAFDRHSQKLKRYLGYYHMYYYSYSWSNLVICAVVRIWNENGQVSRKASNVYEIRKPACNTLTNM